MVSIGKYFELLFGFESHRAQILDFLPAFFFDTVPNFLIFFGSLVLLRGTFFFIERYNTGILGELMVRDLREKLFEHQLHLNMKVYDDRGTGKYLLRYSGDLKSIQNYLTKGVIRFSSDIVLLGLGLGTILYLTPELFPVFIIGIPTVMLGTWIANRYLYNVSVKRRDTRSGLLSFVNSRLSAMLSIKSFNKENPELKKFLKRSGRLYRHGRKYHRYYQFIQALIPTLLFLMLGGLFYAAWRLKGLGVSIDQGVVLGSILILISMLPFLRRTLRVSVVWKLGNISFGKLLKVFELEKEPHHDQPDLRFVEGALEIQDVDFGFNENNPVFNGLQLQMKPGTVNLVRGKLGAGKSSLIKLLLGIYSPQSGKIFIDGNPIENVNPKSIRRKIAVVSDDWPLLGRTVFEAISYSRKQDRRPAAEKMLDRLQEFLPPEQQLSLDDLIGEHGNTLSKGQRKILNYTRALLTRKPILVIDDPFSGLDKKGREHIGTMLDRLRSKRTIIILNQNSLNGYLRLDQELQLHATT